MQLLTASEGRTLVVAPAMIHDGQTWEKDIAKLGLDSARFVMAPYTSLCDRETVPGALMYATDPETGHAVPVLDKDGSHKRKRSTSKVVLRPRPEFSGPWDTVIADEAHYLKGRKTTWTRVLQTVAKRAERLYLATGTPISNFAPELFPLLQLLYPEKTRGGGELGSYWRWVETWFQVNTSFFDPHAREIGDLLHCSKACLERPAWDPCDHYREFFAANMGEKYMQRLRDDVLTDLPPLEVKQVETPMTKRQGIEYRKMKKECLAESVDGDTLIAWSKSAAHIKLDQMATGLGIPTGSGEESGKLERLRFDLENRSRPTLVTAHYRATVDACVAVAKDLGLRTAQIDGGTSKPERLRAVEAFQAGGLDVLVGSLETISEGLTLTAADMVIYVEHSWKPSRNQQALRRIHRIGQERPCTALDYVTPGTVDANKRELLATKADRQIRTLRWGVVRDLL